MSVIYRIYPDPDDRGVQIAVRMGDRGTAMLITPRDAWRAARFGYSAAEEMSAMVARAARLDDVARARLLSACRRIERSLLGGTRRAAGAPRAWTPPWWPTSPRRRATGSPT